MKPEEITICIDAGHGDHDPGAVGPTGKKESDLALEHSHTLRMMLERIGFKVIMTRTDDTFLSLTARAKVANKAKADYFISIHCNSAERKSARGFEVFTSPGETGADPLAASVFYAYERAAFGVPMRAGYGDGGPDKEAKFTVLVKTAMPAILVELGFISNPDGEKWLADPKQTVKRAEAIKDGVVKHILGDSYETPKSIASDEPATEEEKPPEDEEDHTMHPRPLLDRAITTAETVEGMVNKIRGDLRKLRQEMNY